MCFSYFWFSQKFIQTASVGHNSNKTSVLFIVKNKSATFLRCLLLFIFRRLKFKLSTLEPHLYDCTKLGSAPFQWIIKFQTYSWSLKLNIRRNISCIQNSSNLNFTALYSEKKKLGRVENNEVNQFMRRKWKKEKKIVRKKQIRQTDRLGTHITLKYP